MTRLGSRLGFPAAAGFLAGAIALAATPACAQDGDDAAQAGVSAAVYGDVQLTRAADAVGVQVESGEPIFLGDAITAAPESGMQIMLMDQTVFTVGPRTELTVDRFIYDPATNEGEVAVSVAKGVFRFATGLIAQETPENMTVNLPFGTIGIRGTIVAGSVAADSAQVVLLGPGDNANTADRIGRISVSGLAGGGTVEISRTGYGTVLTPDAPPTPPAPTPAVSVGGLLGALERDSGGDGEEAEESASENGDGGADSDGRQQGARDGGAQDGDAQDESARQEGQEEDSGQAAADGPVQDGSDPQLTGAIGDSDSTALAGDQLAGALSDLESLATTEETQQDSGGTVSEDVAASQPLGEITTVQELSSVTSGTGKITGNGALTGGGGGNFNFTGTVDFGQQMLAFELKADWASADLTDGTLGGTDVTLSAGPESYAQVFENQNVIDDFATGEGFKSSDPGDNVTFSNLAGTESMEVKIRMRNGADTVAKFLDVKVDIDDNGTPVNSNIVTGTRDN